jgi:DNA-binding transcriptional MerR regulator
MDTDMTDTLTIRQMCDAFDVTPRTLRFYEAKELLAPQRVGQKRLFTRRDRARLKLILRGKRFGLSLEEIRQILDLYRPDGDPHPQLAEACTIGQRHLDRMIAQRAALDEAIDDLKTQLQSGRRNLAEIEAARSAAQ